MQHSTIPLLSKSETLSLLPSSLIVQADLFETAKTGFLATRGMIDVFRC